MAIPYDETFEEFERRTGLDAFFSDYSTEVRGKLLSKNLERPKDIYDVIYPKFREDNLSKNVISKTDLEVDSQIIREALTKNLISKQTSLEKNGELERKRLESKNKLIESSVALEDLGEESRKSAIQKNIKIKKTLDAISKEFRNNNFRRKKSVEFNLDSESQKHRESSLSKNLVKDNDPYNSIETTNSSEIRRRNLTNNISEKTNDLEVDSSSFRSLNESKNSIKTSDLLNKSESERNNIIRANTPKESYLESESEDFRNNLESKNIENSSDLEAQSNITRSNLMRSNFSSTSDLELDSANTQSSNKSRNSKSNSDLERDSENFRNSLLSSNDNKKSNVENISQEIRADILSKNQPLKSDLETESSSFRGKLDSKNKVKSTNLESFSENFRTDLESKNISSNLDLDNISKKIRQESEQSNIPNKNDLKNDSIELRQDDLSKNKDIPSNLEFKSSVHRQQDLAFNNPIKTDLEGDSFEFREQDLSSNKNKQTNLEFDSESFRQDNLSSNSPVNSNLEEDSIAFRNSDMSSNSSNTIVQSDLLSDGEDVRKSNLNTNVPSNSELIGDSFQTLSNSVAKNIPNKSSLEEDSDAFRLNNLFNNITQPEDLAENSINIRKDNLVSNVSRDKDLGEISQPERKDQKSSNVPNPKNLLIYSNAFRNEQLSKNPSRFSLGTNIILEGTSTFVGVSRLEVSGAIFRNASKLLNGDEERLKSVFDDDESINFLEQASSNQPIAGGRELLEEKNSEKSLPIIEGRKNLQGTYGTSLVNDSSSEDNGLGFYSKPESLGFITNLISLHNIQQNTFQARPGQKFEQGVQSAINDINSFGAPGFQELISKTGIQKRLQPRTNSTPSSIITENNGQYLSASAEKIIKPLEGNLGDGVSMASQTDTTDTIGQEFDGENSKRRGVRHIINTIAEDDTIKFGKNFSLDNIQGRGEGSSSIFTIGKSRKDGSYKKSYNRFNIKNPYAPEGAKTIRFTLTNYSIPGIEGTTMSFPPYIDSFQHGDSATWNSTTFLGRPEPIYTYGSSSRDGSVSFYVLTDFATKVDIGYKFDPASGTITKLTEDFSGVAGSHSNMSTRSASEVKALRAQARIQQNALQAGGDSDFLESANEFTDEATVLENRDIRAQNSKRFLELGEGGKNLYAQEANNEIIDGYIESKPEDTIKKLAAMKSKTLFQPAYFSGSKVDFLNRMEFISKMTRPARNRLSERANNGFSFSRPPVCHLTLGDWLDHDIIVNSVSYDYSNSPWTLDDGKCQPMWCKVTLNFNIIGSYGSRNDEDAPLSTDQGGYFSPRRST